MATDATLALRQRQRVATETLMLASNGDHRPVKVVKRRALVANPNALHYCEPCRFVFDETQAHATGWAVCPQCEHDTEGAA